MLDDIGHEAIDTHKAGPTVRHDHIGLARPGGINFHTGTPVIFENNTVQDCGTMYDYRETLGQESRVTPFKDPRIQLDLGPIETPP